MSIPSDAQLSSQIDEVFRRDSTRIRATLIRLLGDFDIAEDALQEAFSVALKQWPIDGVPANPTAWLVSTARFKGIDAIRRQTRQSEILDDTTDLSVDGNFDIEGLALPDDTLRLIFTCCHPSLAPEAQVALTLREVCGLTTEEVARAFLTSTPALAQRIVRAKNKIREDRIPYEVPAEEELDARLDAVLRVVYLLFNEGYYATSGESVTRQFLSDEAIRLGRLLAELLPNSEVFGLLALMLLQESRRAARSAPNGDLILLENQDRSLWDHRLISEGFDLIDRAFNMGRAGSNAIQAAIVAVHARSESPSQTDWSRIVELYDALIVIHPGSVVELNRAVAVGMRDGPEAGLSLIDAILQGGKLEDYGLAHAARADFCRRLGLYAEAKEAYERALELATQEPERRFLTKRIQEVTDPANQKS